LILFLFIDVWEGSGGRYNQSINESNVEKSVPGEVSVERQLFQVPKTDFGDLPGVVAFAIEIPRWENLNECIFNLKSGVQRLNLYL
jgi:hypothetical protein